jgi:two-component system, NarL family, nitrate/nitrite response regulator NarL
MNEEQKPIRIVVGVEQSPRRRSLRQMLEFECGFQVIGEASSAQEAVQVTRQVSPDVLLLDEALLRDPDVQAAAQMADSLGSVRIVALLKAIEKASIVEALQLGAHGMVMKTSSPELFLQNMRGVTTARYWFDNDSLGILVEAVRETLSNTIRAKPKKDYGLTRRELDIISKIVNGRSNREVGEEFSISERTVKHHLTNIYNKVGVSSRLQLALFAVNQHLAGARKVSPVHTRV